MDEAPNVVFKVIGTLIGVLMWSILAYFFWGRGLRYVFISLAVICGIVAVKQAAALGSRRG